MSLGISIEETLFLSRDSAGFAILGGSAVASCGGSRSVAVLLDADPAIFVAGDEG
jgi:hypothetical protein